MWQTIGAFKDGEDHRGANSSCILLTTHSMEEAETLSNRLAIMTKGGKINCHGTTLHIKNEYGSKLHVNLKIKENEFVMEADYDECDVNMADNENNNNIRGEIFNQAEWSRTQAIEMFELKGLSHLSAQIKNQGVFCPESY